MNNQKVEVKITRLGGPILIKGDVDLVNIKGEPISIENKKIISICGCGKTMSSVFCDGSHSK